jgi:hypothetical protein
MPEHSDAEMDALLRAAGSRLRAEAPVETPAPLPGGDDQPARRWVLPLILGTAAAAVVAILAVSVTGGDGETIREIPADSGPVTVPESLPPDTSVPVSDTTASSTTTPPDPTTPALVVMPAAPDTWCFVLNTDPAADRGEQIGEPGCISDTELELAHSFLMYADGGDEPHGWQVDTRPGVDPLDAFSLSALETRTDESGRPTVVGFTCLTPVDTLRQAAGPKWSPARARGRGRHRSCGSCRSHPASSRTSR